MRPVSLRKALWWMKARQNVDLCPGDKIRTLKNRMKKGWAGIGRELISKCVNEEASKFLKCSFKARPGYVFCFIDVLE